MSGRGVTAAICGTCDRLVVSSDPDVAAVLRASQDCPECGHRPVCINCVAPLAQRHGFAWDGQMVGPLCPLCAEVVTAAVRVADGRPTEEGAYGWRE